MFLIALCALAAGACGTERHRLAQFDPDYRTATPELGEFSPKLVEPVPETTQAPIPTVAPFADEGVAAAAVEPTSEQPARPASAFAGQLSEPELRALLVEAGAEPDWVEPLVAIVGCESHGNPAAVGDSGNSLGLAQLWRGWFYAGEDPFDPLTNLHVAVRVRALRGRFGGGGGWSCADLLGIP